MTIKEFSNNPNRIIDLNKAEGNVYFLIGVANQLARQLEKDSHSIIKEMMSADYGNAVYVFNRELGDFFEIILPKGMTEKDIESSYQKAKMSKEKNGKVPKIEK